MVNDQRVTDLTRIIEAAIEHQRVDQTKETE